MGMSENQKRFCFANDTHHRGRNVRFDNFEVGGIYPSGSGFQYMFFLSRFASRIPYVRGKQCRTINECIQNILDNADELAEAMEKWIPMAKAGMEREREERRKERNQNV